MTVFNWTEGNSCRAKQIWTEYQQHHDVSEKAGQTAGIDPGNGCIFWRLDPRRDRSTRRRRKRSSLVLRAGRICNLLSKGRSPLIDGIITEEGVPAPSECNQVFVP